MRVSDLASPKFRWIALIVLSLGLAIVIIDNTVINVAIPYIIRDLHTDLPPLQWVISGYALIIAMLLIPAGRLGDVIGRKRVFIIGLILFAIGSFIASISPNVWILFMGEAVIEAIGAAMMMTTSLSLLATEFQGAERAKAFGIWGAVAGVSATIGPLLGGYFTTYFSWRWSFRINLFVAVIALIGTVFIKEAKGEGDQRFDVLGTVLSGLGLLCLVFAFIEGQNYGWWNTVQSTILFDWKWPFSVSIIPYFFVLSVIFLMLFIWWEFRITAQGKPPLLRMDSFKNSAYSLSLIALLIISLGQFGVFFIMPIYLQNVLGLNAFQTGVVFLASSITIFIFGTSSGFVAAKIGPKWLVCVGMFVLFIGTFMLKQVLDVSISPWDLVPSLVVFGIGIGMTSAQLTNLVLSAVPTSLAGEASATNSTVRQVGSSIGIAILGTILATNITSQAISNIQLDYRISEPIQSVIISNLNTSTIGSGNTTTGPQDHSSYAKYVKQDVQEALVSASQDTLDVALIFILAGAVFSLLIPPLKNDLSSSHSIPIENEKVIVGEMS